eukprot:c29277_g2_i2 orf=654-3068(+)
MVALRKSFSARSDLDWREAKARAAVDLDRRFAGFIFVCNNLTVPDLDRQLFGLPAHHEESVRAIRKGMPLFLYNYSTRLLHGVFEAVSDGGYNLDPRAWENTDISKIGRAPVSRYPAQVKVCVRATMPPLDEETFRPVLDHQEDHKFKLELTQYQVQQLLQLFGAFCFEADRESAVALNKANFFHKDGLSREPESPDCVCNSDSDSNSVSSGGGTYYYEDELSDELYFETVDNLLCYKTNQLTVEELQGNCAISLEKNLPIQLGALSYSGALMSGVHSQGNWCTAIDDNVQQTALKGMSRRPVQRARPELLKPCSENSMLLRLHDEDPAVNSNSINFVQLDGLQISCPPKQETVNGTLLFQPQVESLFNAAENVVFIPVSTVHCQQPGVPNLPTLIHRTNWDERKQFIHGWSGQSFRQQFLSQDKLNRQMDARSNFHNMLHTVSESELYSSVHPPNYQHGQIVVPLCMQGPVPLQDQGHMMTVLSPLCLSSSADHSSQCDVGASVVNVRGICHSVYDSSLSRDEQQCLYPALQVPVLLMPSFMQKIPCHSLPRAGVNVSSVHYEILDFAKIVRPSRETRLHAEASICCVRNAVRRLWPNADVEVFGSFATGLCLRHSDVDLAVVDAPFLSRMATLSMARASALLIHELAQAFRTYYWCDSITVIDTASVPVLKCHCRPANSDSSVESFSFPAVAIDITIGGIRHTDCGGSDGYTGLGRVNRISRIGKAGNKHTGGAAREYVLQKICDLPALAPLVLLLKSFLHHKGLSDVYTGGLGSFSLTLLVAYYLESFLMILIQQALVGST